jgi:hypothetical protein
MSQIFRPSILKQSRAEHLEEFDRTMDWLERLAGHTPGGRFQTYRARLGEAFRLWLDNRPDQILRIMPSVKFIEISFEASALIEVWREFRADDSPILRAKLLRIVDGQPFTSSEGKKTEPRDTLFELELAALFKSCGLPVTLNGVTDFSLEFKKVAMLFECKRVQTPNALSANLQDAASQLCRVIKTQRTPSLGIVGINVSKIVHLDASGVPLYAPTQHGSYTLPPEMVAVQNEDLLEAAVKQRFGSFIDLHIKALQRPVPERVAGCVLFYRVPGLDMNAGGRIIVPTYPRIGSLVGATVAEDKLLRDLHSEMLKNFCN